MKNGFDSKWKFLRQFLVARSVRRTSIIYFHEKRSNFQEKKEVTSKRKKTNKKKGFYPKEGNG